MTLVNPAPPLVGIFVGGRGARMGGRAKGLLERGDGQTILAWQLEEIARASNQSPIVLVGRHPAYLTTELDLLEDDPGGIGPLGGLRALLVLAERLGRPALALACDMPHVRAPLIARLIASAPTAPAVAPRIAERWQPLFARYQPARVLPIVDEQVANGQRALFRVLDRAGACALPLSDAEQALLADWDSPEDMGAPPAS